MSGYLSTNTIQRLMQPPEPGNTHLWLAQVAGGLKILIPADACVEFLQQCCDEFVWHRSVPDREIQAAVDFAYGNNTERRKAPRWPEASREMIDGMLDTVAPCFDGTSDMGLAASDVLPGLFEPGELVCAGIACERPLIREVEDLLPIADRLQFVCVNPMRGMHGINLQGRKSVRCLDNVAMRRHLVMEIDDLTLTKPMQATLASVMARFAPLVLVVDSGGKSLHCWYRVDGMGTDQQSRFFALACLLGADRTRWDACGWLRMPGGLRRPSDGSQKRQRILFFDENGGCHGRTGNSADAA